MLPAKRFLGRFVLIALLGLGFVNPVGAVTFLVDTPADTVDDNPSDGICADADGDCSLRAAIMQANASAGADIITLPARTYMLTIKKSGVDNDDSAIEGDLDIIYPVTINGAGAKETIISGYKTESLGDRIFHILDTATNTTINNLTIRDGLRTGLGCTDAVDTSGLSGSGLYNAADGTIINSCWIINNGGSTLTGSGGGVSNAAVLTMNDCNINDNTGNGSGGGIYNHSGSSLTITGGEIKGNAANTSGGGIKNHSSTITSMTGCSIDGNTADTAGGGIHNSGTITTMTDCSVDDNTVTSGDGGGIHNRESSTITTMEGCSVNRNFATSGGGGGIHNHDYSTITLMENCTVNDNTAEYSGGGIHNHVNSSLTMEGCTVNNNTAGSSGGGIHNHVNSPLKMTDCNVNDNTAEYSGGGIHNHISSSLTMTDCIVNGNTADYAGDNATEGYATEGYATEGYSGGGIHNHYNSPLTMEGCTVNNNTAGSSGGGIHNHDDYDGTVNNPLTMSYCTVNYNSSDAGGGGIHNHVNSPLDMDNCAVNYNVAGGCGGGIKNHENEEAFMTNCTVSYNVAKDSGGGIHNSTCDLTMEGCTVNGNTADFFPTTTKPYGGGSGGGIQNNASTLEITNTTIDRNSSTSGGGGGIDTKATSNGPADATLVGCTVSKNTSLASGGGIRNHSSSDNSILNLINTTVSGNHSDQCTGGVHTNGWEVPPVVAPEVAPEVDPEIYYATTKLLFCTVAYNTTTNGDYSGINDCGDVTIENTIVAYNSGTASCPSSLNALGLNIIYDYISGTTATGCDFGDLAIIDDQDPSLWPLANNGGPTFTHALKTGSPALDQLGDCSSVVAFDQRGVSRPQNTYCDIGAFEAGGMSVYDDGDGVDTLIETCEEAPYFGDGNGDGIFDAFQSKVTTLKSSDDTDYITIEILGECGRFEEVVTHDEASQGGGDPDFDYPFGLVAFKIPLVSPCESARVRAYFHGATEPIAGPYRKYGPKPDYTSGPEWYSLLEDPNEVTFGTALIGPNQDPVYYAEFTLIAGKLGDDTADKRLIVDQGGPGDPNAIPTLNEWGMIIFTLLIVITGIYYRRKELS